MFTNIIKLAKQLEGILGVFQKLANSPLNDHEGFYIAESVVEFIPLNFLQPFLPGIFDFCFKRKKTTKFIRNFSTFTLLFSGKHGGAVLLGVIDQMEVTLFKRVLETLILPNIQKVSGLIERKICAVGLTRLITEAPAFFTAVYGPLWPQILMAIIRLMEYSAESYAAAEDEALLEIDEEPGYGNSFSPLAFASKPDADPFKAQFGLHCSLLTCEQDIPSPQVFLAQALCRTSGQHPGTLVPLILSIDTVFRDFIAKYIAAAGIPAPVFMLRGGCHCGRTRYEVSVELLDDVANCHCSMCRRTTGASLVTWSTVADAAFHWVGEAPALYSASPAATRYFCPRCGAHLALVHATWPGKIDFTVATLEYAERFPPTRNIWVASHLPWVPLGDLPCKAGET